MNKKILVGSIIAVVILILVSFTGVVGYQTTKSSTIAKASPLFSIRSKRAIGEESKVFTCKYVGKGNTLPFPERNDKAIMVQKFIDKLSKMDDKTFYRFIAYIINYARKGNRLNGVNPDQIKEALYLLRYSDKPIPIFDANKINHTFGYGLKGFLVCTLLMPFWLIEIIVFIILVFSTWCFNPAWTSMPCLTGEICPRTLKRLSLILLG